MARRVRTPTLLQMEAVECGAAALGIILAHHGRYVPLAQLRRDCGVSRDGTKALNLVKAARRYGLEAKGWKKELDEVEQVAAPFIVFWNFNHFLVVEGFTKKDVWLNDPAAGPRRVSREEFDESFTGVVITLVPGPAFEKGGRPETMLRGLASRLSGFRAPLLFAVLASALLVVPNLVVPAFTKVFVDQVLVDRMDHWLKPLLVGMLVVAVLKTGLTWLQLSVQRRFSVGLSTILTSRFVWHLLRLPAEFYGQRFAGEIASRARSNELVADVISNRLTRVAIDVLLVVFYGAVMATYDPVLCSLVVVASCLNLLALSVVSRTRADAQMSLAQEMGKSEGASIAGLQRIETIKASAHETSFFRRWVGYTTNALNAQQALAAPGVVLGTLPTLLQGLARAGLLALGGLRVMDGRITIGDLVALQSLMESFQQPIGSLVDLGQTLQELKASMARLDDVLANPLDPTLERGPQGTDPFAPSSAVGTVRLGGRVEFKDVTFGYSTIAAPLIEGFDLRIEPGQRVALVGGSGSGKSTLARLATGLSQPWSGEVLFDGKPAREHPRVVLSTSVAFVEQEILLFAGTVRENLTLWDTTVPHASVVRACEDAAIDDVIRQLPGGYEAPLLEGASNLSGGQRQRLEIARALIYDPAVLVLDEATSALDAETERVVEQNLRRRGCTCLVIAHRLSTIRDCDQILVLKEGRVVQRGTHAELWADAEGEYASLIRAEGEAVVAP